MDKVAAYVFAGAIDDWTVLRGQFDFERIFPNEEVCRAYLFRRRWPSGFVCPRCYDVTGYELHNRELIECANRKCRYQTSITSGTIFHRSKLPLRIWFKALQLYTGKNIFSPSAFSRLLKVSYKTAWSMLQKLHEAYKCYDREQLSELHHPLAAVINDPADEEDCGLTDEILMAHECTDGIEEEGALPDDPEEAAAFSAAGLLLQKKITKEEWMKRKWIRKVMFQTPGRRLPGFFLLYFNACIWSPPIYRINRFSFSL
ncbi:IS1595 family transposase [Paenibacillus thermotolerans]|uniref:IS1595 family transposase n=1 Tax=Paenibacillus thermotolerans TaxID=3027807 RepID=UPI0023680C9B|nr:MULTISPECIES: IS1595 family transposase [unclassified Paenibacillus]